MNTTDPTTPNAQPEPMPLVVEPIGMLLPCPFCGSPAEFGYNGSYRKDVPHLRQFVSLCSGIWVQCSQCEINMGYDCNCPYDPSGRFKSFEEAAEAWNQRTAMRGEEGA